MNSLTQTSRNEILLRFFRGENNPSFPHRLEDIVVYTDEQMEDYHDFIQWIFPTIYPSRYSRAPIIDESFAKHLHADHTACKNYCRTCQRYLNYMNFDCEGDGKIVDSTRNIPFYRLPYHNFLRITRMLDSLNQTAHNACSKAIYEKMFEVMHNSRQQYIVNEDTLNYWKSTQQRPLRRIIFLDLDGVMDSRTHNIYLNKHNLPEKDEFGILFSPECIAALKHITDNTDAEIVLSSSWKHIMSLQQLQQMWQQLQLPSKVIDVTPTCSRNRGDEIHRWLCLCPDPCQYVIIDDLPREQFHTAHYSHLVTTDGFNGLTLELANQAIEILRDSEDKMRT